VKVVEIDLDSDDEGAQPVRRTATAETWEQRCGKKKTRTYKYQFGRPKPRKGNPWKSGDWETCGDQEGCGKALPNSREKVVCGHIPGKLGVGRAERTYQTYVGLEKGPNVDRVGVVTPTRERQPPSKHEASRTDNVWVTPRAKERADNRKG
jgi:hypothetical protein